MQALEKLSAITAKNNSLLCVGPDPDIKKLPAHLVNGPTPQFTFNQAIIDTTHDAVCAFKPNTAFYEARGSQGILELKLTCDYIKTTYPEIFLIIDAKRADIGSTNESYAQFVFDYLGADAVTLHPYLGAEAIAPFLERKDKACIILCRTSNPGAKEFQDLKTDGEPLYQRVAKNVVATWNTNNNCMLVVGATYPAELVAVRKLIGDMPILIPGVGAQGGDVEKSVRTGLNSKKGGIIISTSRAIIFASNGPDFAERAREEAIKLRDEINKYR